MPPDKTIDTVLMILAGGLLALGLGSMLLGWMVRQWDRLMSRPAAGSENDVAGADQPLLPAKHNAEIAETSQRIAEIRAESFTLGETEALARLVAAGKVRLTDAVKIGADAKSGERYQRRSREIKAAIERRQATPTPIALRPTGAKFMEN